MAETVAEESKASMQAVPARAYGRLSCIPLVISFGCYLATVRYLYEQVLQLNSGRFIYALDDAYIHLALAKNLVHGFYGATAFEHSSPSSSVGWPFLLASIFKVAGVHEMTAFWLQLPIVAGTLALALAVLHQAGVRNRLAQTAILLALTFLTSLVNLTFIGMEHIAHCGAMLAFCWWFSAALEREKLEHRSIVAIALCAALLTGSRYEGLFTIAIAGAMALIRRRLALALAVGVGGGLPVLGFGIYSLHLGGHLLPNSLLLKGHKFPIHALDLLFEMTYQCKPAFLLMMAGILFVSYGPLRRRLAPRTLTCLVLFIGTSLLHALFARWNWFYRYEAYLLFFGILTAALVVSDIAASRQVFRFEVALGTCALLACMPALVERAREATWKIPGACHDIYSQQFQMARFFGKYYPGVPVALNDVGAVDFFTSVNTQDLVGLTSYRYLKMQPARPLDAIDAELQRTHTRVIAIYTTWFQQEGRSFPSSWKRVESWKLAQTYVLGGQEVTFLGVGCENAKALAAQLKEFDASLPREVSVQRADKVCDMIAGVNPR